MDALAGLLDGARARGAFLIRTVMDPPWAIRIVDGSPLSVVASARGTTWIVPDGHPPVRLAAGAVAIIAGTEPYVVADDPGTAPTIIVHPGQRCESLDGRSLEESMTLGVRTWGTSLGGRHVMLSGTYETVPATGRRLLDALPRVLVVGGAEGDMTVIELLNREIVRDELAQDVVLDRLLDLVLVSALRHWLNQAETVAPAWCRAHADPTVGRALRLLQSTPATRWTVAGLAAEVGVSRAGLARRFTDLVGEAPMGFLTGWRLAVAADRLADSDDGIAAIAADVGYSSAFSLSAAFKRHHGVSPRQYRAGQRNRGGTAHLSSGTGSWPSRGPGARRPIRS